ncbi:MAG: protein kinase [Chloroflexi bacterium]|nr:protein kinase [Chloroflexota bacterium]
MDEADAAISRYDWEALREAAQAVLRLDPENSDALAYLAAAERDTGSSLPAQPSPAPHPIPAPIGDQPTSFANGRYQVKRFLGEGGKKKVYLAHDTTLDREVAFALIKTEGLDDTSRVRIQREAQAMGRLGSHPHIVTVFDLGEEGDQPYMVTELMGGGDVEGLIEKATDHRLPLEQAIKIAQETCRGMGFAHDRGIVHRDLKPGNIWLTEDGIAKIGDFGLAVALDRSRLTTEGMMVGTVSYMPPEQAMGGEVTPRSDLYSLGAMLYEMVTGRPPFLGDDSVAIIGQHINTPPVAPTWHNSECPRALDALIIRLLAKDPSERPESASDVLAALDAIDVATSVEQPVAAVDEAHALDSLAGGVFVGRQREMGDLKAALEDALSGRGRLVMLVGEPGIGKTRTAQELVTYAGLRGAQVLWGRCYEGEGAPPYWPWVQAIRSYVRNREPEQLRSDMGAGAADIAEIVSDVGEQLPGLNPPAQLEPEQARFKLFDSITAFLRSAGQRQPLVLVLDDLHWADHPSLLLLEFVARELSNARLLIIGTYRDVEVSRRHPLSQTLGELTRERLFQRVLLRGLDRGDVGRFIELVSGVTPPSGMLEAVYTQTEGNPLFVTEVVRLLVQEGEVGATHAAPLRDSDTWTVRIPEGVREVIGRRLDRLTERCNETLTVASVIGREFSLDQLKPIVEDVTEDRLLEVLEEALSARVIEELPQAVGRYQFTHALIQETLSEELSTTRRVRLHGRIAEALEALYGDDAEAHAAELAHHFAEAQTSTGPDKLVRYSLMAGERALASHAYEDALAHFERGLVGRGITLSGTEAAFDEQAADLLFGLARAQSATVEAHLLGEAFAPLRRAFEYYAEAGNVALAVAAAEFPIAPPAYVIPGVTELVARALSLVPADSHEAGRLLSRYGVTLGVAEGDYEGAQQALGRAIAIARREGDVPLEVQTLTYASAVSGQHLNWQESVDNGLRAIELATGDENPHSLYFSRFWTAASLLRMGDLDAARPHAMVLRDLAENRSVPRVLAGFCFLQITHLSCLEGDWRAGRESSDRGLEVSPLNFMLLVSRVLLEHETGESAQGEVYLERLLEAMGRARPDQFFASGMTSMTIAAIARITGVPERLEAAEAAAEATLSTQFATPLLATYVKAGLALLAVQNGDQSEAAEHYSYLLGQRGTMIWTFSSVDRLLGLLSQTIGNLDEASVHFEDALAFCRKAGYRPELAWTCCDYADMLRERDGEGDRAKAISLLDESLAISSELGMRPLLERVLSRRELLGA